MHLQTKLHLPKFILTNPKQRRHFLAHCQLHSPWLARLTQRYYDLEEHFIENDPKSVLNNILKQQENEFCTNINPFSDIDTLQQQLCVAKQRLSLVLAWNEVSGAVSIKDTIKIWSDFAQKTIQCSIVSAIYALCKRKKYALPDMPNSQTLCQGITVLAMGKLGEQLLNYSSDVDLIILYDLNNTTYPFTSEDIIRAVKTFAYIMHNETAKGYIFRVDFRLRPDPASTPIAVKLASAEIYYESAARTWERAAMIKARPVAGDITMGNHFIKHIQSFIWKKYLDFYALEEIGAMVRSSVHPKHLNHIENLEGFDLKRSYGTIRTIEFFVQALQLVWGGRVHSLRTDSTLLSLNALSKNKIIHKTQARNLTQGYYFLRLLEHRVQMINDQQTHKIPIGVDKLESFTKFCGLNDKTELFARLQIANTEILKTTSILKSSKGKMQIQILNPATNMQNKHAFENNSTDTKIVQQWFIDSGFKNAEQAYAIIQQWKKCTYNALQNNEAARVFHKLVPTLLETISQSYDKDIALRNFDLFLQKLPTGVQLLSALSANASLLRQLTTIIANVPRMAHILARRPERLDMFFTPHIQQLSFRHITNSFKAEIHPRLPYEISLSAARKWLNESIFLIDNLLLEGHLSLEQWQLGHTNLCECCIRQLIPIIGKEYFGENATKMLQNFAILSFGRTATKSLTCNSDIDGVFIWKDKGDTKKFVAYNRFAQRIITAFEFGHSEGILYTFDTRLRPDGTKSALATSLSRLLNYYEKQEAWGWEILALASSRPIFGNSTMKQKINLMRKQTLTAASTNSKALCDSLIHIRNHHIKSHLQTHANKTFSLKHQSGCLLDLELLTQYLLIVYSNQLETPYSFPAEKSKKWQILTTDPIFKQFAPQQLQKAYQLFEAAIAITRISGRQLDELVEEQGKLAKRLNQLAGLDENESFFSSLDLARSYVHNAYDIIYNKSAHH